MAAAGADTRGGEGWRAAPLTTPRSPGKLLRPGRRAGTRGPGRARRGETPPPSLETPGPPDAPHGLHPSLFPDPSRGSARWLPSLYPCALARAPGSAQPRSRGARGLSPPSACGGSWAPAAAPSNPWGVAGRLEFPWASVWLDSFVVV